jgi:hypothetical protein
MAHTFMRTIEVMHEVHKKITEASRKPSMRQTISHALQKQLNMPSRVAAMKPSSLLP